MTSAPSNHVNKFSSLSVQDGDSSNKICVNTSAIKSVRFVPPVTKKEKPNAEKPITPPPTKLRPEDPDPTSPDFDEQFLKCVEQELGIKAPTFRQQWEERKRVTQDMESLAKRYIRSTNNATCVEIEIGLQTLDTRSRVSIKALLDSGATQLFIDEEYAKGNGLKLKRLARVIPVFNVDGTCNQGGSITSTVDLAMDYKGHKEIATFSVCNLGSANIIIGHAWLKKHNPEIDWKTGEVRMTRCPKECGVTIRELKIEKRIKKESFAGINREGIPDDEAWMEEPEHKEEVIRFLRAFDLEVSEQGADDSTFIRAISAMDLAIEAHEKDATRSFTDIVPPEFHKYRTVFEKTASEHMPMEKPWDHAIDLKEGFKPKVSKLYPLLGKQQEELDTFLEENLRKGYIRPSKSPQASLFFFTKKKDGKFRPVQDYRALNEQTVKNAYPLPLISELVEQLKGATIFTKMDLRWGYNNIRMKKGDEWKAAFITNRGLYEPTVMFFGLCNSPSTFQTMMNDLFRDLIAQGLMCIYMDDILVYSTDKDTHRRVVDEVLQRLLDNNLFVKPEKCEFYKSKIEFLSLIIENGHVSMDPVKIEGVAKWQIPTKVKEVQSFLGFANFYQRFIKDFSNISKPLNILTRKDQPWKWGPEQQKAFEDLKKRFMEKPILISANPDMDFLLECDASNYATGAVLSQKDTDDKWHPVAYLSKSFNDVERNYDVHDKELLSIIRALDAWRHHLEGCKGTLEILTDHRNLTYFTKSQKLNRRQARWAQFMTRFFFTLTHRPGKLSGKPDHLSRRADHNKGEDDNSDIVLLKPELFHARALNQGHAAVVIEDNDLLKEIRNSKIYDEAVVKAVQEMKEGGKKVLRGEEWYDEQGLILYRGKVYVPKNIKLRRKIVKAHHDNILAGHPGRWKTLELISWNYWWPGMTTFVTTYIAGCDKCQRTKIFPEKPICKLMPNPIPMEPWTDISADFIIKLPRSQGYDLILIIIDRFSKMVHLIPTHEELSALGLATLYRDNVWKHHGLPRSIISDRGPQFASKFMKELNGLLGIDTKLSTAYHPQTDGQTERVNMVVEQYLRLFTNHRQDDWADWLALAEFTINNSTQSSSKQSPFYLNYGKHPRMGTEPTRKGKVEAAEDFASRMKKTWIESESALKKASDDMKRFTDMTRGETPEYAVGDQAWLDLTDYTTSQPQKKLSHKRAGPFKVIEIVSPHAIKLQLPQRYNLIHPVFNIIKLRKYMPPAIPNQAVSPDPPIDVEGVLEYEVERVLDSRMYRGRKEYLVKWKGYTDENNSWEPEQNLNNSPALVEEFH